MHAVLHTFPPCPCAYDLHVPILFVPGQVGDEAVVVVNHRHPVEESSVFAQVNNGKGGIVGLDAIAVNLGSRTAWRK